MPIYDYRCDHCGHAFSAVRAYTDDTAVLCPSCGKVPRRLMSMPAIVFKGSGWYKTDSRPAQPSDGATAPAGEGAARTPDADGAAKTTPSDAGDAKKSDKSEKGDKGDKAAASKPSAPAPAAKSEAASS